jgi:hypothetical protein
MYVGRSSQRMQDSSYPKPIAIADLSPGCRKAKVLSRISRHTQARRSAPPTKRAILAPGSATGCFQKGMHRESRPKELRREAPDLSYPPLLVQKDIFQVEFSEVLLRALRTSRMKSPGADNTTRRCRVPQGHFRPGSTASPCGEIVALFTSAARPDGRASQQLGQAA